MADPHGRPLGLELILPDWFYTGVLNRSLVLTIDRAYFDLTGGLERWLYRLVRKHGGHQRGGWSFDFKYLHAKSGSLSALKHFAYDMREIVRRERLPGYRLLIERGLHGAERLHFTPIPVDPLTATPPRSYNQVWGKPVNSFVPWGTAIPVRLGTRSPCFRGPKSPEIFRSSTACRARNFTNPLNLTCCCEPAGCEQVDWRDRSYRFQALTNTQIRQCDVVFGDTRMHASACVSTRSSSSLVSNVRRHTRPLRKSRRDELANPGVLISWAAGPSNASLTLHVSVRRASNEGAAA